MTVISSNYSRQNTKQSANFCFVFAQNNNYQRITRGLLSVFTSVTSR